MFKNYWLLSLLCLAAAAPVSSQPKDTLTACGHHDYPPWNWLQDGEIVGVCADITKELFSQLGMETDFRYIGPWKRCQHAVEEGTVDINICAFKNAERQRYSNFSSHPMGLNENAVFVYRGKSFKFEQLSDLSGKSIALVLGVSLGTVIDDYLSNNTNIFRVQSQLKRCSKSCKGNEWIRPFLVAM